MKKVNAVIQYLDNWMEENGRLDVGDTDSLKRFMEEFGKESDRLCSY